VRAEDKMWLDGAKTLLSILIKLLVAKGEYKYINLANIRYLINNYGTYGSALDSLVDEYADNKTFNEYKGFVSGNPKTVLSFVSTANTALNPIGINDNLEKLTASHDINFENFRKEKSVFFIKIPAHKQSQYSFLLNLFYAQFFNSMMEKIPSSKDLPVYCLLDEFGNMNLPNFTSTITTIRKHKVSISIILQDISQLEEIYGTKGTETILGGAVASKLFFSGADLQITKMLETLLGEKESIKTGMNGELYRRKEHIMSAKEIRTMKDNEVLFIYANRAPAKFTVKPYYKDFIYKSYSRMNEHQNNKNSTDDEISYISLGDDE